ncbi:Rus Holliday junction resolvase [uncultured Caudovirales phage]|uniref:Rus Holliday junction resolvase n=1 Tax=uncultured Caudovirales phage TaxID=2100421 RepID=A0A6J7WNY7_9CAUD|nr:Rus Holliday junction resolvase [uncultured Caudovirales phage]
MARDSFSFTVWQRPAPQGSKKYVGTRRTASGANIPLIVESSAYLPAWRKAVVDAVKQGMLDSGDDSKFDGAVRLEVTFYLPKPKTVRTEYPVKPPDIDKVCRSLLDGITYGGVWLDDSLVVDLVARKRWAKGEPGAAVTISAVN